MRNKIIVIACAMKEEYRQSYQAIFGTPYYGEFGNEFYFTDDKIIWFSLIGIGKIQSAVNLSRLLAILTDKNHYGCDYVLNVGFAAGVIGSNLGDVVFPSKIVQHDFILPDEFSEELKSNKVLDVQVPFCTEYFSQCASGDKFVDKSDVEKILKDYPNITCFDMESASVALACKKFKVPMASMKIISDIPQDEDNSGVGAFMKMYRSDAQKYFDPLRECLSLI